MTKNVAQGFDRPNKVPYDVMIPDPSTLGIDRISTTAAQKRALNLKR